MEDFTLRDVVSVFKRRNKCFFITFSAVFAVGTIFALNWSNYRSVATVEIKRSEIAQNMTTPNSMDNSEISIADQRIVLIQQKVTSSESLQDIIQKYNLYKSANAAAMADAMRSKIKLDFIISQVSNPAAVQKESAEQLSAIAFTLSFDYSDPKTAQAVTNELVARFIDADSKQKLAKAKATSEFLAEQISQLEKSMAEQEKKIAAFQAQYGESGPSALMFNQQASVNTSLSLQNIESQITSNEGTQGQLRSQLATVDPYSRVIADGQVLTTPAIQLKALEAKYADLTGHYGTEYPDVIKLRNQIKSLKSQVGGGAQDNSSQLKAQIADTRVNLAAAQSNSGPNNPDVIALKFKLEGLEKQLAASGTGKHSHNGDVKDDADNPAYLSLTAELRSAEEQHKSLLIQKEALTTQQTRYQKAINENPATAQQMAILSRDYDNAQIRYRELKEKKMAADMNQQLEQDGKSQSLQVTNAATLPHSTQPSRFLILLGGFVCAIVAGVVSVIFTEATNQSVHDANHLASIIGTAPLVTIPYIYTAEETSQSRNLRASLARITVVGCIMLAITVMPYEGMIGAASHMVHFS